jgi:hypothetical protein
MDNTPKIERQEVVTQRFTWKDGSCSCGAGDLLCTITLLTESQKPDNYIDMPEVTDYLKNKGLIEQTADHRFKPIEEKREELVALGDDVSNAIGTEIENLPANMEIKLAPSIHLIPQGVSMFTD